MGQTNDIAAKPLSKREDAINKSEGRFTIAWFLHSVAHRYHEEGNDILAQVGLVNNKAKNLERNMLSAYERYQKDIYSELYHSDISESVGGMYDEVDRMIDMMLTVKDRSKWNWELRYLYEKKMREDFMHEYERLTEEIKPIIEQDKALTEENENLKAKIRSLQAEINVLKSNN